MKQFITLLLTVSTTFSCSYIKEKLIGFKQPKIENFQTLKAFTEPHGFDAQNLYAPVDSIAWKKLFEIGIVQAIFFNSKGHRIMVQKGCTQDIDNFINDSLGNEAAMNRYPIDSTDNTFASYQSDIIQLERMQTVEFEPNYDYTVLITWTKWSGTLFLKQYTKKWFNTMTEKGYKVRPIFLSMDYMEHTGMTVDDVELKVE